MFRVLLRRLKYLLFEKIYFKFIEPRIKDKLDQYINRDLNFVNFINQNNVLVEDDIKVLDVGCSGGVDKYWNNFKDILYAGIDSNETEINLLNKNNNNSKLKYFCHYIGTGDVCDNEILSHHICFEDTFASKFNNLEENVTKYLQECSGDKISDNKIEKKSDEKKKFVSLKEFCLKNNFEDFNFLKVDVDGYTLDVLKSSENLIDNPQLFGLKLEVGISDKSNNDYYLKVANFLENKNFTLIKILPWYYSSKYLPNRFMYSIPAQSFEGFLYFSDFFFIKNPKLLDESLNKNDFIKFLMILELLNLNGLAIQMVLEKGNRYLSETDIEIYSNLFCKKYSKGLSYTKYLDKVLKNKNLLLNKYEK